MIAGHDQNVQNASRNLFIKRNAWRFLLCDFSSYIMRIILIIPFMYVFAF